MGGANAFAGFHFQLDIVLLEGIESWLRLSPSDHQSLSVFTEILSDAVIASANEPIVAVQVKLTQSTTAIRKGLGDLLSVHEVALSVAPDNADDIAYRLVFRSGDLDEAHAAVKRWVAEDPKPRRHIGRNLTLDIKHDPAGEIVSLLANEFLAENPEALRQGWIGDLLEAASVSSSDGRFSALAATGRRIWGTLAGLRRRSSRRRGIHLVSPRDRAPTKPGRGTVLTGQQPTITDLTSGRFAERPL